jgi:hypothetical protein
LNPNIFLFVRSPCKISEKKDNPFLGFEQWYVQEGYIPVHAGYIPVHEGYIRQNLPKIVAYLSAPLVASTSLGPIPKSSAGRTHFAWTKNGKDNMTS